jgi:hypothetical protein
VSVGVAVSASGIDMAVALAVALAVGVPVALTIALAFGLALAVALIITSAFALTMPFSKAWLGLQKGGRPGLASDRRDQAGGRKVAAISATCPRGLPLFSSASSERGSVDHRQREADP